MSEDTDPIVLGETEGTSEIPAMNPAKQTATITELKDAAANVHAHFLTELSKLLGGWVQNHTTIAAALGAHVEEGNITGSEAHVLSGVLANSATFTKELAHGLIISATGDAA